MIMMEEFFNKLTEDLRSQEYWFNENSRISEENDPNRVCFPIKRQYRMGSRDAYRYCLSLIENLREELGI